jgi:putative ABC transport system permease protein
VINRAALAKLGVRAPQAAIGKTMRMAGGGPAIPATVVGVVEDTRFRSARDAIEPAVYVNGPRRPSWCWSALPPRARAR